MAPPIGFFLPTRYFLATGIGMDEEPLLAFDRALISAGIGNVNLIYLSSTLNPSARITKPVTFRPGSFVGVARSKIDSNDQGAVISASVSVAIPIDGRSEGVIMEYAGKCSRYEAAKKSDQMAASAMKARDIAQFEIQNASIESIVSDITCCFAAVVQF